MSEQIDRVAQVIARASHRSPLKIDYIAAQALADAGELREHKTKHQVTKTSCPGCKQLELRLERMEHALVTSQESLAAAAPRRNSLDELIDIRMEKQLDRARQFESNWDNTAQED